jgi:hypothetical protein
MEIAIKIVKCLAHVCELYGCKTPITSLSGTVAHYAKNFREVGSWMAVMKWKLAAFYSQAHDQTPPTRPNGLNEGEKANHLLGGGHGRWLRNALRSWSPMRRESLLMSILMSKKGMPRPSRKEVDAAETEFPVKMTKKVEDDSNKLIALVSWAEQSDAHPKVETTLTKSTMCAQLKRTVVELLRSRKRGGPADQYNDEARYQSFVPSTSANYVASRRQGGALGYFLDRDDGARWLEGLRTWGGYLTVEATATKTAIEDEEREDEEETRRTAMLQWDPTSVQTMNNVWRQFYDRVVDGALRERRVATPVGLAEALKIRVITKCAPLLQTAVRPMWKFMHSQLRRHRTFKLIGTPQCEEVVLEGLGTALPDNHFYLSGDFKGATDNLKSWVSEAIAEAAAEEMDLSRDETALLLASLTQFQFATGEGLAQQTIGQLMGSVSSFPILCIANAAMARWSMEVAENKPKLLRDCALLINGDDVALRSDKRVYAIWQRITTFGGLEESIGKTFFSREFVNINSTSYLREETPKEVICQRPQGNIVRQTFLHEVKYVNLGLLYGVKRSGRVGKSDQSSPFSNMSALARTLLRYAPEDMAETCMRQLISFHKHVLDQCRLPWYIPEWLGGIGLPSGPWGRPSDLDLRIAARILINWKTVRPQVVGGKKEWRIWQAAAEQLPNPVFTDHRCQATERYERMVQQNCINLVFSQDVNLDDLFDSEDEGGARGIISHNQKLWRPTFGMRKNGHCDLPKPVRESEIAFQRKYANFEVERHYSSIPEQRRRAAEKEREVFLVRD